MPQFDYEFFYSQLFWLLVSFTILLFLVNNIIAPRIALLFKERNDIIDSGISTAARAKDEAVKIQQDYKSKLAHTRKTIAISLAEKMHELSIKSQKKILDADKHFKDKIAASEKQLESFKVEVAKELEPVIIDTVQNFSKTILKIDVSVEKIEQLLRESKL